MSRRICYKCGQAILTERDATIIETRRPDATTWSPARLCAECASEFDRWLRTSPAGMAGLFTPSSITQKLTNGVEPRVQAGRPRSTDR